jgi:predicted N-acetyltransferase YhbS
VFGPGRFARTAYRVREGTPFASRFCRVYESHGRIIAALRMTPILIGGMPGGLLLGPLAVALDRANQGFGRQLIADSLEQATREGVELVVLVGDLPYYGRLGFVPSKPGRIVLPGPADPARLLVKELREGAAERFSGMVVWDPAPSLWAEAVS